MLWDIRNAESLTFAPPFVLPLSRSIERTLFAQPMLVIFTVSITCFVDVYNYAHRKTMSSSLPISSIVHVTGKSLTTICTPFFRAPSVVKYFPVLALLISHPPPSFDITHWKHLQLWSAAMGSISHADFLHREEGNRSEIYYRPRLGPSPSCSWNCVFCTSLARVSLVFI